MHKKLIITHLINIRSVLNLKEIGKREIIMITQIKSKLISNLILNQLEPKNVQELVWTGL